MRCCILGTSIIVAFMNFCGRASTVRDGEGLKQWRCNEEDERDCDGYGRTTTREENTSRVVPAVRGDEDPMTWRWC
ncbi:TonB-dependent receptor [Sesbania bispinosa]|nr:TonB-dependent receptor [Sesbania bispinosa]